MTTTEPPVPVPSGTDAHPDADTLADLAEGLLPPSRAAAVGEHLDGCAPCADDLALLRAIPDRLAASAAAGPFPADLAARLEAAAAEEGRTSAATITPFRSARRPGRENRFLQAAAAAVLVLAATAVGVSFVQSGGSGDDSAADMAAGSTTRDAGTVPVLSTGTDYDAESVPAAVPGLLAAEGPQVLVGARAADGSGEEAAPSDDAARSTRRLADGAALGSCVSALTDDADTTSVELPTPLVVDIASFDGQPATVVVLPAAGLPDRLDVFVVGPDCSPADAKVLHFARVPRP
jgi:hypothetical protein